jgi:hypothetical protein
MQVNSVDLLGPPLNISLCTSQRRWNCAYALSHLWNTVTCKSGFTPGFFVLDYHLFLLVTMKGRVVNTAVKYIYK